MKASKGKEFIQPDPNWLISGTKLLKNKGKNNVKKFHTKEFNRKVRKKFLKLIKEYL